jgi:hypothetical protein
LDTNSPDILGAGKESAENVSNPRYGRSKNPMEKLLLTQQKRTFSYPLVLMRGVIADSAKTDLFLPPWSS